MIRWYVDKYNQFIIKKSASIAPFPLCHFYFLLFAACCSKIEFMYPRYAHTDTSINMKCPINQYYLLRTPIFLIFLHIYPMNIDVATNYFRNAEIQYLFTIK